MLVEAFQNSKGNRGLEAQTLKMMSSTSRELPAVPSMAIHAVLTLQSNRQILATTKALSIGHCSEQITRSSRVFAQVLAHADAECIKDNELNHLRKNGVPPRQRSLEDIDPRKRVKPQGGSLLALML